MGDETVLNILCEVASGECVPYDAEPRIVKAVLRKVDIRAQIAGPVLCLLMRSTHEAGAPVDTRELARAAAQAADILLEELANG